MTSSTRASEFVTDTMGLVLRLEQRRLPLPVKAIFDAVESGNATVYVPTMVCAEILYLAEKHRISVSLQAVAEHLEQFQHYREYPMSFAVIQVAASITDIPELHDRLIAGTARFLHLDLITNDPTIQASTFVRTVW
jgi:predicted nucleic acid-binding protein